jgi:hypothetical protein
MRFLGGFEHFSRFLVAALIDQRIGQSHPGSRLIRFAGYCCRRIDDCVRVFAALTGCPCNGARVGISLRSGGLAV